MQMYQLHALSNIISDFTACQIYNPCKYHKYNYYCIFFLRKHFPIGSFNEMNIWVYKQLFVFIYN